MKADVRRLLHLTSQRLLKEISSKEMEKARWNFSKAGNFEAIDTKIYIFIAKKSAVGEALVAHFGQKASKFFTNKRFATGLTRKRSTHSSFPLSSDMKDFSAT